jgi:putative transposase
MPQGDRDFATRWRLIKSTFSRNFAVDEPISASRAAKRERGIWQRRYWEHTIRNEEDLARHIDYVHINPVKHGLVKREGLAAFIVPPHGETRNLPRRLGR